MNDILLDDNEDPTCPICDGKIKPWGRAKCDVCTRDFCSRHRPMFDFSSGKPRYVSFWMCPECKENNKQPTTAPTK